MNAPNLATRLDERDRTKLGEIVFDGYQRDKRSREDWEKRMNAGLNLAMQVARAKEFPWPNCANVIFPLVTIAALQFSARSYSNIIQGTDVVRYRVVGEDPSGDAAKRAQRISEHMSWQVLEEDLAWEEQHDRMLINLGIVGTCFIKTYFDPVCGHNVSEMVQARDFVLDYYAKSVEECARKTQVISMYRNEIYENIMGDAFCDVRKDEWYGENPALSNDEQDDGGHKHARSGMQADQTDEDTPFRILEQHRTLDLDKDGYAEPYIVTIEEKSKAVLRVVARFDKEEDVKRNSRNEIVSIKATEHYTKYPFIPSPDGGIYDLGFGTLLGPLNEAVSTGINQILDAGTMANSNGGFLARGAKVRGGSITFSPFSWQRVDSTGDDLRKSIVPFAVREPSAVVFQLLSLLINYTDRIAGTTDAMVGENPGQNTPAETSRNMTEQGMQVYSVIFKRVWRSMKEEFKKLHRLNGTYMPMRKPFGEQGQFILREDYRSDSNNVIPVADPNITSNAMRVAQAGSIAQRAYSVPGYSLPEVEKAFLRAMRVPNIPTVYPGPDKVPPLPNPKMAVENAKAQVKQGQIAFEKWKFTQELIEEQKLNRAAIAEMEASALKMASDSQDAKAMTAIAKFNTLLEAMKAKDESISKRIESVNAMKEGEADGGDKGGSGGMAAGPGNEGAQGVPS